MARRRTRPAFGTICESFFHDVRAKGIEATGSPVEVLVFLAIQGRQFGPPGYYGLDAPLIAHSLRGAVDAVEESLKALEAAGLVKYDPGAGAIFVPGGVAGDWPSTPKNVEGYRRQFDRAPQSKLREDWLLELRQFAIERGFDRMVKVAGKYETYEDANGKPALVPGWAAPGFEDVDPFANREADQDHDDAPPAHSGNGVGTGSEQGADGASTERVPQNHNHSHFPDPEPKPTTTATPPDPVRRGDGASQERGEKRGRALPSTVGIELEELSDLCLLAKRYRRVVEDDIMHRSEATWLGFVTEAQYALRKGKNPAAMLATNLRNQQERASNEDEDAARRLIQKHGAEDWWREEVVT